MKMQRIQMKKKKLLKAKPKLLKKKQTKTVKEKKKEEPAKKVLVKKFDEKKIKKLVDTLDLLGPKALREVKGVTPEQISEATRQYHEWVENTKRRVARMHGKWNGQRLYLDEQDNVTTINPRAAAENVSSAAPTSRNGLKRKLGAENGAVKHAPKQPKQPVERDCFGKRIGTQSAQINSKLTAKVQTAEQIAKQCREVSKARVQGHMSFMISKGFVVEESKGKYKLTEKGLKASGKSASTKKVLKKGKKK